MPLSDSLRKCTADAHRSAERRPFVTAFLKGALPQSSYVEYLAALQPVYEALETGLRRGHRTELVPFADPCWRRTGRLQADLARLAEQPPEAVAAGQKYAAHLRSLTATNHDSTTQPFLPQAGSSTSPGIPASSRSLGLIGHAYCRYLGDLSGGQILARCAERIGVSAEALSVHRFDEAPDVLVERFRRHLDALELTDPERQLIEDEAKLGFHWSIAIFDEIAAKGSGRAA